MSRRRRLGPGLPERFHRIEQRNSITPSPVEFGYATPGDAALAADAGIEVGHLESVVELQLRGKRDERAGSVDQQRVCLFQQGLVIAVAPFHAQGYFCRYARAAPQIGLVLHRTE